LNRNLDPETVAGIVLDRAIAPPAVLPASLSGRRILVTGAAGSIGSKLCLRLAALNAGREPGCLLALDRAENSIFRLSRELGRELGRTAIATVGDVCDTDLTEELIARHGIDTVIHAAAYKHVPLMEEHPIEAIRNNVVGTFSVVRAAIRQSVGTLLLVSTDKAANPHGIMGRTKRAAELIVAAAPDLRRGAIRLGNVLGSEGSVWTSFVEQIRTGQPVTITHPDACRYFVTAGEAVDFILRALSLVSQGEILVPHMGEPVRIADFARRLGAVMGHRDMEMRVIGLRAGDKLLEDLKDSEADFVPSSDAGLRMIREGAGSWSEVESWIARLNDALAARDALSASDWLAGFAGHFALSSTRYLPAR
jgi:FlaA1/EpsC-like NDP-sugar epimerase